MSQDAGYSIKTGALEWIPIAPGINVRIVRRSDETGHFTVVQHSVAGSKLPRHRHLAPAELYILKGHGLHPQTGPWGEGDYIYEHMGAIHEAFVFDQEATLLMISQGPIVRLDTDGSMRGLLIETL